MCVCKLRWCSLLPVLRSHKMRSLYMNRWFWWSRIVRRLIYHWKTRQSWHSSVASSQRVSCSLMRWGTGLRAQLRSLSVRQYPARSLSSRSSWIRDAYTQLWSPRCPPCGHDQRAQQPDRTRTGSCSPISRHFTFIGNLNLPRHTLFWVSCCAGALPLLDCRRIRQEK